MLSDIRVLDLTDHRGEVGPWLLGRLGAEVVRVEPPGGTAARGEHPLLTDGPEDLRSLQFAAYNDNKRSIVLDLGDAADRSVLLDLVAGADIVFESGPPGDIAAAGVSEDDLLDANDRLVHVLVTPFGSDGPRAGQPFSEATLAALGGPMSLQGVNERAPLKISVPQVWRHTGTEAAVAALMAHRRMETTGRPQWLDVSAQAAMTWTMLNAMEADEVQGFDFERAGLTVQLAIDMKLGHAARDGVTCHVPIGVATGPIVPWLIEEGIVEESWADQDWTTFDHRALSGEEVAQSYDDLCDAVDQLCSRYTRDELMRNGSQYGSTMAPVNTIADLAKFDHLNVRGFWTSARYGDGSTHEDPIRWVGAPVLHDGTRVVQEPSVPRLNEDGDDLRGQPVRPRREPTRRDLSSDLPLAGVNVADFSWVGVGPITARYLADHGATVVKVESVRRMDGTRNQAPFKDAEFGINRSNFFGSFNTSKLSLSADLSIPAGRDLARRLACWADVVIDSFRPGTMDRLGLSRDAVAPDNPGVITVSTSLLGSGGPLSNLAGYGFHASAIAGFTDLVGWPDLGPDGPWMAYTDAIAPRFLATAILAALDRRDRTGEGTHIEGAQLEIGLQYLAPELLDHGLRGRVPTRMANRDPHLAPQGVYPCAGDDQWCAVTVPDDEAWSRLVEAIGSPGWALDAHFATTEGRLEGHDIIDERLAEWSSTRTARDVERALTAAGIPAGMVQRSRDLRSDPQYLHRGFYDRLEHSETGPTPYAGHQFRFRDHDNGPRAAAPALGEHTFEILSELLGMDEDEIADVAASGALE